MHGVQGSCSDLLPCRRPFALLPTIPVLFVCLTTDSLQAIASSSSCICLSLQILPRQNEKDPSRVDVEVMVREKPTQTADVEAEWSVAPGALLPLLLFLLLPVCLLACCSKPPTSWSCLPSYFHLAVHACTIFCFPLRYVQLRRVVFRLIPHR